MSFTLRNIEWLVEETMTDIDGQPHNLTQLALKILHNETTIDNTTTSAVLPESKWSNGKIAFLSCAALICFTGLVANIGIIIGLLRRWSSVNFWKVLLANYFLGNILFTIINLPLMLIYRMNLTYPLPRSSLRNFFEVFAIMLNGTALTAMAIHPLFCLFNAISATNRAVLRSQSQYSLLQSSRKFRKPLYLLCVFMLQLISLILAYVLGWHQGPEEPDRDLLNSSIYLSADILGFWIPTTFSLIAICILVVFGFLTKRYTNNGTIHRAVFTAASDDQVTLVDESDPNGSLLVTPESEPGFSITSIVTFSVLVALSITFRAPLYILKTHEVSHQSTDDNLVLFNILLFLFSLPPVLLDAVAVLAISAVYKRKLL